MEKKPVKIVETVLRDGHQSLAATRMRISDMLPALEQLDNAGYYALEAWGGATFVCARLKSICAKPRFKCCCAVRTFWAITIMPMMLYANL